MAVHAACCGCLGEELPAAGRLRMQAQQQFQPGQITFQQEQEVLVATGHAQGQGLGMRVPGLGQAAQQRQGRALPSQQVRLIRLVVGWCDGRHHGQCLVDGDQRLRGFTQLTGRLRQRLAGCHREFGPAQGIELGLCAQQHRMPLGRHHQARAQAQPAHAQQEVASGMGRRVVGQQRQQRLHPLHGLVVQADEQHGRPGMGRDGMAHRGT